MISIIFLYNFYTLFLDIYDKLGSRKETGNSISLDIMDKIKQLLSSSLFKTSFIYIVADGITKAIPFLLLPFLTHYLHPKDYGIVTNFNVFIQIFSVFCHTATSGAIAVMYYKLSKSDLKVYMSNMLILNTVITVFCAIVGLSFSKGIASAFDLPFLYQCNALLVVWFSGIINMNLILWRCEENPILFGVFQISTTLVNAVLTVMLVIILLWGWKGRLISNIGTNCLAGLLSIFILYKRGFLTFRISKKYLKEISMFAAPIVPHALSFWLKSGADKLLLTKLIGLEANGLYSAAMTWAAIVTMFLASFSNAYAPYLYKNLKRFDEDKIGTQADQIRVVKLIGISLVASLVLILLIFLLANFLINKVYATTYSSAKAYLPYIMVTQYFEGTYLLFVCFLYYTSRTRVLGIITFAASIIQIGLSYLLIKNIGGIGAAISSAIISFFIFIFVARAAILSYSLPWLSLLPLNKK